MALAFRIAVFAPDQHIIYDGRTPERQGVGGGIMARIRLAEALTRARHRVQVFCNCPRPARIRGVTYHPLADVGPLACDVLIINSSAGEPDLRPAVGLPIRAALRLVRVDGWPEPAGLRQIEYDFIYAPSNFIAQVARREWGVPDGKLAVFHHGVQPWMLRAPWWRGVRHPRWLIYGGHPDKGLEAARGVLRVLRETGEDYELHAFGGDALYGKPDRPPGEEAGLIYHGTVTQRVLFQAMRAASFALFLQARQEPFGLMLIESMAAGCVPLASPVGAYPEIVQQGYDGFLVGGDHRHPDTWTRAAWLIRMLNGSVSLQDYVRRNARLRPLTWDVTARAITEHCQWALEGRRVPAGHLSGMPGCRLCGSVRIALGDGYHCVSCGTFTRYIDGRTA